MRAAALALFALALLFPGCRSNEERSAELERKALAENKGHGTNQSLSVKKLSRYVHVTEAVVLHGKEADAVAITVRNDGSTALSEMPIEFTIYGPGNKQLYTNAGGGLSKSLESIPTVPAHGKLTWVDDQVTSTAAATRVVTKVGEGRPSSAAPIAVSGVRVTSEAGSQAIESSLTSPGPSTYHELVVFAVARSGGKVVAAGRALVETLPPHKKTAAPQIFPAGSLNGAAVSVTAPVP